MPANDDLWQKLSKELKAVKELELAQLIAFGFPEAVARAALAIPFALSSDNS